MCLLPIRAARHRRGGRLGTTGVRPRGGKFLTCPLPWHGFRKFKTRGHEATPPAPFSRLACPRKAEAENASAPGILPAPVFPITEPSCLSRSRPRSRPPSTPCGAAASSPKRTCARGSRGSARRFWKRTSPMTSSRRFSHGWSTMRSGRRCSSRSIRPSSSSASCTRNWSTSWGRWTTRSTCNRARPPS